MTSSVKDDPQRIMCERLSKLNPILMDEDLACAICCRLMVKAHQTFCDCRYCGDCIAKCLADGNKYCVGGKKDCLEEELVLGGNVLPSAVLDRKIQKVRICCPNEACEAIVSLINLEDHLRVCNLQSMECPYSTVGCGIGGGPRDTVEAHLQCESLTHSRLLMEIVDNLRNEVGGLWADLQAVRREAANLKEELKRVIECQVVDHNMMLLMEENYRRTQTEQATAESDWNEKKRIDPSEEVHVEEYKFRVKRINERINKEGKVIYSPYVYSDKRGYKIRLRVDPARRFSKFGARYVSVSSVVCKGEYDDELSWPCKISVTASLLKQPSNESYNFVCCNYKQSSNKPVITDNYPSSWVAFVAHSELRSVDGLVEDDSILVHIVIGLE